MNAALVITGASILLLLGIGHTVFTLQSRPDGGPMMPTNADTRAAMQVRGGLGLEPTLDETLYRAWIGFNLSHSLGVIAVAVVLLVHASTEFAVSVDKAWFVAFAVILPAAYLLLAVRFWFAKPRDAIALALVLIWAGVLLELL